MNNIEIFKSEDNILLNESFDGFLKIFINLSIGAISAKLAMLALAEGNKITAICYGVVAGVFIVLSAGYFIINIVGKALKCFELKANKIVGDEEAVRQAEKKLVLHQVSLAAVALLTVGSLYTITAWAVADVVVAQLS